MADPDYFTLAEFRTLPDMSFAATYTDAKVVAAAAYFTAIVERELGVAMIPRTVTETYDGGGCEIFLKAPRVTSITTVTENGVAVTNVRTTPSGILTRFGAASPYAPTSWRPGVGNIVVTYVTGEASCPADIKDAVMWATRDRLLSQADQSGIDVRKTSVSTDFGTTNYILPGEKRPTGYPDLDAAIAGRRRSGGPVVF